MIESDVCMELDELAPLGGRERGAERRVSGVVVTFEGEHMGAQPFRFAHAVNKLRCR